MGTPEKITSSHLPQYGFKTNLTLLSKDSKLSNDFLFPKRNLHEAGKCSRSIQSLRTTRGKMSKEKIMLVGKLYRYVSQKSLNKISSYSKNDNIRPLLDYVRIKRTSIRSASAELPCGRRRYVKVKSQCLSERSRMLRDCVQGDEELRNKRLEAVIFYY